MTEPLFSQDAYRKSCTVRVLEAGPEGIVLDATVFYPTGGGQPGATGMLQLPDGRSIPIVDTRKGNDGTIVHAPEPGAPVPTPGDTVTARIDWDRRYAHMRMHTCLHLLGAVLRYGVTGGAITAERSRLDFDMQDTVDKELVTEQLNELIRADHPVRTRWITDEELDAQPELIRTMSVKPPRGAGRVRLLEIPDVDLQPCGGTHVQRTGEIGPVVVAKAEKKGRRNRRVYINFA